MNPKDGIRTDYIEVISKFLEGAHVHALKVKIKGNR